MTEEQITIIEIKMRIESSTITLPTIEIMGIGIAIMIEMRDRESIGMVITTERILEIRMANIEGMEIDNTGIGKTTTDKGSITIRTGIAKANPEITAASMARIAETTSPTTTVSMTGTTGCIIIIRHPTKTFIM